MSFQGQLLKVKDLTSGNTSLGHRLSYISPAGESEGRWIPNEESEYILLILKTTENTYRWRICCSQFHVETDSGKCKRNFY